MKRLGAQYLLAVPSDTQVRDLAVAPPDYGGRGGYPKRPWTRVDARDGSKGPLVVEVVKRRVVARTEKRRDDHEEVLVATRFRERDTRRVVQTDYYLSNASPDTSKAEFARAAKAAHRVEQCIQRAKSEAGLADYEVRNWKGWHHHQILSLIATWFLVAEARRGKQWTPAITVRQIREGISTILRRACGCDTPWRIPREREQRLTRNELTRLYHWKQRNRLAPLNINKRQI